MARYHGKRGLAYIAATHAGAAVSVGNLNSWSFDGTRDTAEVTCFTDSNKVYVLGLDDAKGSFSGFWDNAVDTLFAAGDLDDSVAMYLYPSADALSKYWHGYAFVTGVTVETSVGDAISISADWVASGVWTRA